MRCWDVGSSTSKTADVLVQGAHALSLAASWPRIHTIGEMV
jgi:hypothetical protein